MYKNSETWKRGEEDLHPGVIRALGIDLNFSLWVELTRDI
jgi:hypothetical protein